MSVIGSGEGSIRLNIVDHYDGDFKTRFLNNGTDNNEMALHRALLFTYPLEHFHNTLIILMCKLHFCVRITLVFIFLCTSVCSTGSGILMDPHALQGSRRKGLGKVKRLFFSVFFFPFTSPPFPATYFSCFRPICSNFLMFWTKSTPIKHCVLGMCVWLPLQGFPVPGSFWNKFYLVPILFMPYIFYYTSSHVLGRFQSPWSCHSLHGLWNRLFFPPTYCVCIIVNRFWGSPKEVKRKKWSFRCGMIWLK